MNQKILDLKKEPKLTVALPVYNSRKIAWISLESLTKQIDINFDWELIIYEEIHSESVFPDIIYDYVENLKKINCVKILFITSLDRPLLVDKWIEIGKVTSASSEVFILHAADCHSPKKRLSKTFNKIYTEDYDWYDQTKGYFYSFISDRIILYDFKGLTNLNMGLKTSFIKSLPKTDLKRGIDGYIYNHCLKVASSTGKILKHFYDYKLYKDSVDTHGFNNISLDREKFFESKPHIFKIQKEQLEDLPINGVTIKKLRNLGNGKTKIQTKTYDLSIIISTFKNTQYLNDCFNSIIESIGNKSVEVLIGIDSCLETYEFVLGKEFPSNFRFYFFEENNGPYIVFNTLSELSKSENIMFFGSDDIMDKNMVEDTINSLNSYSCFKPKYVDFKDGGKIDLKSKKFIGEGVFGIKKSIFEQMNGFEPWMCAADSDFMGRLYKKRYRLKISNKLNFYRRVHHNSLTNRKDTGMISQLRATYAKTSKNKKGDGNPDRLYTRDFVMVGINTIIVDTKNNEYYNHRKSQLDKVLTPTPRKVVDKQITKKDPVTSDRLETLFQNKPELVRTIKTNKPQDRQELINKKNNTNNTIKELFPSKPNRREGKNFINFGGKFKG